MPNYWVNNYPQRRGCRELHFILARAIHGASGGLDSQLAVMLLAMPRPELRKLQSLISRQAVAPSHDASCGSSQ
jgi:hypothetical protein